VHFERGGCDPSVATKHVVFLHGFGVGTFHYERQLADLGALVDAETGDDDDDDGDPDGRSTTCVWALDFVGQGASWPCDDTDEGLRYVNEAGAAPEGFRYSVDTWRDQVVHFLTTVVRPDDGGAYLAGNSLGGYVAAVVAATETETNTPRALVKGLLLLNATPFWAFAPNDDASKKKKKRFSLYRRFSPWDGASPAPRWIRAAFSFYWDAFRSETNVKGLLRLVYGDKNAVDAGLVRAILTPTRRACALDAFCSVVFSPKSALAFDDATRAIRERRIPTALVYGRDDPWVVPLWGQRLKRAIPEAAYYELPGVGHCPAHEAPEATNACVAAFVSRCEKKNQNNLQTLQTLDEALGAETSSTSSNSAAARFLVDGAPRNAFERLAAWRETRA
jgi:pimeloyl-ACP methyl ester carboxylesterase